MQLLTEIAARVVTQVDFTSHFSAVETLIRASGDCTGTAVVLAALGRAAGIPTRVADGLVYSAERYHGMSNAFMPHSWTLAYVDGRWRSFDAALPVGFDTSHIALSIGDGDDAQLATAEQLASLLRRQGMTEIRRRPGYFDFVGGGLRAGRRLGARRWGRRVRPARGGGIRLGGALEATGSVGIAASPVSCTHSAWADR